MLRLFESAPSGNSYKVRLLLANLGRAYERVPVDLFRGEARTAEFLSKNPAGKVPLLQLESGEYLAESNAILWYLAQGTKYLPKTTEGTAQALRWMFFEQNALEPPLAGARFLLLFNNKTVEHESVKKRIALAEKALLQMEIHLSVRPYFVGDHYSIADISLFAYTHIAEHAEIDLAGYPNIADWIERIKEQSGFVPMDS